MWFVLKDHVLYSYRAPEDTAAVDTCPVLGFDLEVESEVREGSLTRRKKTVASRDGFESLIFAGSGRVGSGFGNASSGRAGFDNAGCGSGRDSTFVSFFELFALFLNFFRLIYMALWCGSASIKNEPSFC